MSRRCAVQPSGVVTGGQVDKDCPNSGKQPSHPNLMSAQTPHRSHQGISRSHGCLSHHFSLAQSAPPHHSAMGTTTVVAIPILARAFHILLETLHLDPGLYPLHSLQRGGTTAAYRGGSVKIDIKKYRLWASNTFWL